ncbi:hypothetical protein ASPZODRAFT_150331 [Penicilliopsis zonata CBS 506.65]|uniref:Defect at low temperature protein 1 n=1 Tax=Penicilliopsis zonata CBS 506.65 TaxID=1073090 RepID=A0A1L9SQS0_9EURO|nr:hypothetical protein ASPZODRAFT_150331 [Penicilliopsis zonata CBS 506.65]OJJ49444.1 hypothetical protein ASPZODRAFT_150331 [Penicilliopsis zonata CBS 506.65]
MAPLIYRILESSTFIFLSFILLCLILLTPADAIYQCYVTRRFTNVYFIAGGYIVTFLLALLIYASRIYTNRSVLAGIPKAWIPVEKEDVGKSVRRLVMDGLARSAIIAYQARPRNTREDEDRFLDYKMLLVDRDRPPWGRVEHRGWSSPASLDLPDLPYRDVVKELPHLIEAKAVSLAPSDPLLMPSSSHASEDAHSVPDTRVVEVLKRPTSMGLREYLQHLTTLDLVNPPDLGPEFLAIYEKARFSSQELYQDEFREMMRLFTEILRGMVSLSPQLLDEIRHGSSYADSESRIGPSDEEGETDTVDLHHDDEDSEALARGRSHRVRLSDASSTWDSSRSLYTAASASDSVSVGRMPSRETLNRSLRASPRTPSMRSLRPEVSNLSGSSAGSAVFRKGASLFSSSVSSLASTPKERPGEDGFRSVAEVDALFPKVDPAVDGEECLHDCASCTIRYPAKFDVEMSDELYGKVNGWSTHMLVATGKSDWVRDVADEKGSLMEAIEKGGLEPSNGRLKLTASNMPVPDEYHHHEIGKQPTNVLLLPSFTLVEQVTPDLAPDLIKYFVSPSATTTTPLAASSEEQKQEGPEKTPLDLASLTPLRARPCPHAAVILLCSQRTRDARCGQSAPLLKREFERHLRPLGLYRDMDDERPGGVAVYFISHVGGHKYSANVMIYRRRDMEWYKRGDGEKKQEDEEGAAQGIWLARVRPEDCENIIKFTVLQGKLVKPGSQLRAGFDREKGLTSW